MADAALIVTAKGMGKLVDVRDQFSERGRGGKGVACFNVTPESGPIVAVEHVDTAKGGAALIVTKKGMALLTAVSNIPMRSRTAGGVKVMDVADDDAVIAVRV